MNEITTRPARARAYQQESDAIDANIAKIEAAKPARSALQLMAERLNVPTATLKTTLMNTVFKGAKEDEFVALVIVANEYQLNPLTKEIYAFPAKGGGIVPVISVDGWISIMNRHPMFDGIEFNDIPDEQGKLYAIETIIYRKDRTRPIKVVEYLEECKRNTDPWRVSPARMLRHKSLIQCNRIAFGFSGVFDPDNEEIGDIGFSSDPMPMRDITPRDDAPRQTARPPIHHDAKTGEVIDEQATAPQGGEAEIVRDMKAELAARETVPDVNSYLSDADWSLMSEEEVDAVRSYAGERIQEIKGPQ